ncbi:MAG: adenylate kinase [Gammaproteobacteria bacterium]|jgi:adenylate kinase|nr:adenylate kinase [Chromatiales bacterium]MCP4926898.1 adenylate kinase [Gammaproteobacteria bacterium]MDP7094476.1 adenylate kinase [Gammaproteobacteria bacterium]MDP7295867.1 adenylate kinase [Gammaproteobacteria bacterium]MDP7418681.1 adenylate kinase [Gammaproteobacteria bacterium]
MKIVFLGAPGSGKGTQAQRLMAEHSMIQVSTGDLLREAVTAGTELGQLARQAMDAGELVSDEIVLGMLQERLQRPDIEAGFILDGFPRNLAQAKLLGGVLVELGKKLDAVVLLDVDLDILLKRLTGRRTCSLTGKLLNIYFSPESELDACTEAGGELIQRADDNEETIGNRLDVYRQQTEPLIEYYQSAGLLRKVDGQGDMDAVYGRLKAALGLQGLSD